MDRLRAEFEALGFQNVSTFIASGNVLFEATGSPSALESKIEARLTKRLGYGVPTFVRSASAVRKASALEPYGTVADGHTHLVVFLRKTPTAGAKRVTEALSNDHDRFEVHGREVHWLVRGRLTDSSVKSSVLVKALGQPSTGRNAKSLRKLAAMLDK